MRRHNFLFDKIVAFSNLNLAAKLARKNNKFKPNSLYFHLNLEKELFQLKHELQTMEYTPGAYYHFTIYEPKKRLISAAPYRDRVVHHAIHNILEPIFDPTFIYDSYATRKNKGTHRAINRFQTFSRKNKYAIKFDIKKYFPNINRDILMDAIKQKISCKKTLNLIQKIVDTEITPCPAAETQQMDLFSMDGIPIGNLTSQFFANIYLNGFDHFVKQHLRCRYYIRYMDDFVIFHNNKKKLWTIKKSIQKYLNSLKLNLHEEKSCIYKTIHGVPFLGMIIYPNKMRLKRQNIIRFKRRLKNFQHLYKKKRISWQHINQSVQSWIGHAKHADSWKIRGLVLWDHPI